MFSDLKVYRVGDIIENSRLGSSMGLSFHKKILKIQHSMNKLCQNSGKQSEVYRNQDSAESTQRQLQIVGKLCDLRACFYPNPTPGSVVILRMEACVPSMGMLVTDSEGRRADFTFNESCLSVLLCLGTT